MPSTNPPKAVPFMWQRSSLFCSAPISLELEKRANELAASGAGDEEDNILSLIMRRSVIPPLYELYLRHPPWLFARRVRMRGCSRLTRVYANLFCRALPLQMEGRHAHDQVSRRVRDGRGVRDRVHLILQQERRRLQVLQLARLGSVLTQTTAEHDRDRGAWEGVLACLGRLQGRNFIWGVG